jgi:NADH-quinone oxidoreductase subunit L
MMTIAVMAAMFHLVTHAFFKALLFLSAGNVMHAMGDVIDMRRFGGLRKYLPKTHGLFAIGAATLAGLPPLAAFFSKDTILSLLADARLDANLGTHFTGLLVVGFLTALLTAIYTAKAYFKTFWGSVKLPDEAGDHPHEATAMMLMPMYVLAVGAVLAGGLLGPTGWILHYLAETPFMPELHGEHHEALWVMLSSAVIAIAGGSIGYSLAFESTRTSMRESIGSSLGDFARNRLYIDAIYNSMIVTPLFWIGQFLSWFDRTVVDGLTLSIANLPATLGLFLRNVQTGFVSSYAYLTILGVAALAIWIVWQ